MAVPEIIRKVNRPTNTVVQDSGREGPKRYVVRERKAEKYIPGGNPQPINGKTVGYIIDLKFVPVREKTAVEEPQILSYGAAALVKAVSSDILEDLLKVFQPQDAYSIFSMAAIKVIRPHISGDRMASAYKDSFLHRFYPGAALSKNSVSAMYRKLGEDGKKRDVFFHRRIAKVEADHHIAIDGTLKQNISTVNDLSAFSYKARLKNSEDISILYAYDIELMEPVCGRVFPGNSIDAVSYRSFIRDNGIKKGIIIADKGFPPNNIRQELEEYPDLHYLTPVKRNDKRITTHDMLNFQGVLEGISRAVQYKKEQLSDGMFLYAFRDAEKSAMEEKTFLERSKKGTYSQEAYNSRKNRFGLIVFESDLDMDVRTAYLCYGERWKLELVFKAYKSDDCLDRTMVHGDFSIHGSEFVNFISTLITCRIITKATDAGIFNEMSYGAMLDELNAAWRRTDIPEGIAPVSQDDYWVHTIPKTFSLLEKLGLCNPIPEKEPAKPGPKPGSKKKTATADSRQERPKRPVGRPRKNPLPDPDAPKRPVGRPRKNPLPDPNAHKRPVGRPRKNPLPDPDEPKNPVGRPPKVKTAEQSL